MRLGRLGLSAVTDDDTGKQVEDDIDEIEVTVVDHHTAKPIGKQLFRWPEIDLTDATVNNSYWKGYLRAYKFSLGTKIDLAVPKRYILHVTCFTAGKRIVDIFDLNTKSD